MLSERAVLQEGEEKTFHVKMLEIWYFYHVLVIKNLSEKKMCRFSPSIILTVYYMLRSSLNICLYIF